MKWELYDVCALLHSNLKNKISSNNSISSTLLVSLKAIKAAKNGNLTLFLGISIVCKRTWAENFRFERDVRLNNKLTSLHACNGTVASFKDESKCCLALQVFSFRIDRHLKFTGGTRNALKKEKM